MSLETSSSTAPGKHLLLRQAFTLALASLFLFVLGCKSSNHRRGDGPEKIGSTEPPDFLTGPCAAVLAGPQQFSAHVVESAGTGDSTPIATGNLLYQEGRVLLIPTKEGGLDAKVKKRTFRFIWDLSINGGYVICEALRGYARIGRPERYSLAPSQNTNAVPEQVGEQPCHRHEMVVLADNGARTVLTVWRADESDGLPIKIAWESQAKHLTLLLSEVAVEAQTPELFDPPGGFSRYPSTDAMVSELVRRPHPLPYSHEGSRYR